MRLAGEPRVRVLWLNFPLAPKEITTWSFLSVCSDMGQKGKEKGDLKLLAVTCQNGVRLFITFISHKT